MAWVKGGTQMQVARAVSSHRRVQDPPHSPIRAATHQQSEASFAAPPCPSTVSFLAFPLCNLLRDLASQSQSGVGEYCSAALSRGFVQTDDAQF